MSGRRQTPVLSRRVTLADGRRTARVWSDETPAELVDAGMVPVLACEVRPGDRIACRPTMFGFASGNVQVQTVTEARITEYGSVVIETATTSAEEDDGLPVWIVAPKNEKGTAQ